MIAFSLTNRPRLGQAKGGLAFKGKGAYTSKQGNRYTGLRSRLYLFTFLRVYLFPCFRVYLGKRPRRLDIHIHFRNVTEPVPIISPGGDHGGVVCA